VLPAPAREKIGLGGEALFQGKGDKFHILDPQDGAAAEEDVEALMAALGQGNDFFDPLSLVGGPAPGEASNA
ncbi:MAG: cell division/cell wall cluster transcriptional repressor MraZ, partial [Pseudomonadota bacterium]